MGPFAWFSCLLSELWSLNCQKLYPFLQFFAVIAIFVYASESSRYALLENGIGYYAMT